VAGKKTEASDGDARIFENRPSSLDELTHAEMLALYRESTDTLRFVKHLQWWTIGSTLLTFGALIGIARMVDGNREFVDTLMWIVILLSMTVIFTLAIYQFWQHTESVKIEEISRHMSTLFVRVRRLKSAKEANIHRYLLLAFMSFAIVLGAIVTSAGLEQMLLATGR